MWRSRPNTRPSDSGCSPHRRLEEHLAEDAGFTTLLDEVVARRLDPASAASTILERFDAGEAA